MNFDICYIISHGFSARMIFDSDLIPHLKRKGLSVAIVTPNANEESMQSTADRLGISLFQTPKTNRLLILEYLVLRSYIYEDIKNNPALWAKHLRSIKFNESVLPWRKIAPYVYYPLYLFSRKYQWMVSLFKRFEKKILKNKKVARLLRKINPKLIVATYPVDFLEGSFIHMGVRNNIKTVTQLLSWDNITCKGHFPAVSDYFISWGPIMSGEIVDYYNFEKNKIFETGIPHFDKHILSPDIEKLNHYMKLLKLDPEKPYLFLGMSSPYFAPHEIDIVEWLANKITKNDFGKHMQLVVRPHPQNVQGNLADLNWLPRLKKIQNERVAVDFPLLEEASKLRWNMKDEDLIKLVNLIFGCSVSMNSGSTLSIDSIVQNKPVVLTSFDADKELPWFRSVRRTQEYLHLKKLINLKGVKVAKSFDELEKYIIEYLENPDVDLEQREKTKYMECGVCDGKASERVADALYEILND